MAPASCDVSPREPEGWCLPASSDILELAVQRHLRLGRGEIGPAIALGDRLLLARERRALVGHLEEQQERELFQVVLVREPVVAQDVAVGPELLDDTVRRVAHAFGDLALGRRGLRRGSEFVDSRSAWMGAVRGGAAAREAGRASMERRHRMAQREHERVYTTPGLPPFEFHELDERLLAGRNPLTAVDVDRLVEAGVTHVVDLREESEWTAPGASGGRRSRRTAGLASRDWTFPFVTWGAPSPPDLDACSAWISRALTTPGTRVYVRCRAGRRRSRGPARQEPPRRPRRAPPDEPRLRRVLRQPLSPERGGGAGERGLPEGPGVPQAFRPARSDPLVGAARRHPEDRGHRPADEEAHGGGGRRDLGACAGLPREAARGGQAVLSLVERHADALPHPREARAARHLRPGRVRRRHGRARSWRRSGPDSRGSRCARTSSPPATR